MADLHTTLIEFPLVAGVPVRLSPLVRRITAPNPSPFTGPGTNTYLIGDGDHLAVVDPGPEDSRHIDAIVAASKGKIRWIIATHNHMDHSPAAKQLAELTGAELIGPSSQGMAEDLDDTFQPKQLMREGDLVSAPNFNLEAIHTPGHIHNHFSFLLREEGMLLAGDHIMQGSTVVIISRHGGTMWDYLDSLQKLSDRGIKTLAPAHGHLLSHAEQVMAELYHHRLVRENMVINAIQTLQSASLGELIPLAYPEVGAELVDAAKMSLRSHLLKLERDGLVSHQHEQSVEREIWFQVD